MSVMCAVFVPEGIAMATDSRMTVTAVNNNDKSKSMMFSISDNAQKIVLLNKVKIGISACGQAVLEGKTISDYLRIFEINEVREDDDVTDVANKLFKYASKQLNSMPPTNFFVWGYAQDEAFVYSVNKTITRNNMKNGQIQYSTVWSGEPTAITKLLNSQPPMMLNPGMMPLKDAIDFSEFLVDVTIKYQRFESKVKTCGGDIDLLVLTKDDAFWHQHKVFKPIR